MLKTLALATAFATLSLGVAVAQNQTRGASSSPDGSGAATVTTPSYTPRGDVRAGANPATENRNPDVAKNTGTSTTAGDMAARGAGTSAPQSGDHNQAVATTGQNATAPAHGASSFTEGQARSRIEANGFSSVTDLSKDADGVWHGKATKDGRQAQVWLDYRGNVGQR
jgi:hypothetical protein